MLRCVLVELGPTRPELHEPLGIESLAGVIDERIPEQIKLDLVALSFDPQAERRLLSRVYDVVGLAAKLGTFHRARALWQQFHEKNAIPPLIVVGDLLASDAPECLLEEMPDVICARGEAEDSFTALLELAVRMPPNHPDFRTHLENVPNLVFRRENGIVYTHRTTPDLTRVAPPRREFLSQVLATRSQVQMEASRGCPWSHCSFCSIPGFNGPRWRPFPLDWVMSQIEAVFRAGARSVYFTDSDFVGDSLERAHQFADQVLAARKEGRIGEVTFYANFQVSGVVGGAGRSPRECEELLSHLRQAGLREVFIGLESGAREQVQRYAKASTPDRNKVALEVLARLGIETDIGFIMFDPFMRLEELQANLEFLRACGLWGHPGRLTKALRIQPNTIYARTFFGGKLPRLNVNNLTYPYEFRDPRVDRVYRCFRAWELHYLDYETLVQGAAKGEVPDESVRRAIRQYLGRLRYQDLRFLEAAANSFASQDPDLEALERFASCCAAEMRSLIENRPQEVEAHATRLGMKVPDAFELPPENCDWYKVLNAYEDPVYTSLSRLEVVL